MSNPWIRTRLQTVTRKSFIVAALAVVVALVAAYGGWKLYRVMTTNTIVAYFTQANGLYPGDEVTIMGVAAGSVDKIEPAGDKMKVTFHYQKKYAVPATASAVILNPSLVASRNIQLEPPYTGGPVLMNNTVIPPSTLRYRWSGTTCVTASARPSPPWAPPRRAQGPVR